RHGGIAAEITCQYWLEALREHLNEGEPLDGIDHEWLEQWLRLLKARLASLADDRGSSLREFACTALCAVVGPQRTILLQVGDGGIVYSLKWTQHYQLLCWPQNGE